MNEQILYVEGNKDGSFLVNYCLKLQGFNVTSASTAAEVIRLRDIILSGVYILDKQLPDRSGIDLCPYICELDPTAIVIFSASAYLFDREMGIAAEQKNIS